MATSETSNLLPVSTGLVWGLKRSLLGYLRRIPDGRISIDDGVHLTSTLDFHFPLLTSSFDTATGAGILRFSGLVHLYGHFGAMDVTLANPWLHLDGSTGILSFNTSQDQSSNVRESLFDIPHVPRAISVDDTLQWEALQPNVGAAGAELFQANYPLGVSFDPLHARIPAFG